MLRINECGTNSCRATIEQFYSYLYLCLHKLKKRTTGQTYELENITAQIRTYLIILSSAEWLIDLMADVDVSEGTQIGRRTNA